MFQNFSIAEKMQHNGEYMKRSDRMGAMISYTMLGIVCSHSINIISFLSNEISVFCLDNTSYPIKPSRLSL
jgi:glucan phosphorylase